MFLEFDAFPQLRGSGRSSTARRLVRWPLPTGHEAAGAGRAALVKSAEEAGLLGPGGVGVGVGVGPQRRARPDPAALAASRQRILRQVETPFPPLTRERDRTDTAANVRIDVARSHSILPPLREVRNSHRYLGIVSDCWCLRCVRL